MATQTLIFICCPNNLGNSGVQRLSVYLTPRLDQGATLAAFPDLLDWTQQVKSGGLKFQVRCGASVATASADTGVLRPDLWRAIFTATTFVEKFQVGDFAQRLLVSYPTRDALSFVKNVYQRIGSGANLDTERSGLLAVLRDLVFRDGDKSNLADAISAMRVNMWHEQQDRGLLALAAAAPSGALPPDGVPTSLTPPANARDAVTRAALFHNMPPAPGGPALPRTAQDFAKTLDFHRALSALNSYPSLLRALGLVFDLQLPKGFCVPSPVGNSYGTVSVAVITPGVAWKLPPSFVFPETSYVADAQSFDIAPATAPADVTGGSYQGGDVAAGFVFLSPQDFHLAALDLDGALLKALGLADNAAYSAYRSGLAASAQIVGETLPALRSAGISLMADGRGMQMLQKIDDNTAFDQALQSNGPMPRPFDVRDLIRGFRLDIWSSRTRRWHSLHRRNATYSLGAHGPLKVRVLDEEGFLQPTAAQPAEDPTRPVDTVSTANNMPQPGTDLYVHERIARWEGWSLSVFRPGLALNRSEDPAQATVPDPTMNQPMTPFKMTTEFTVTAGSLPELRFGARYRVRARAVDLAGNSLSPATALPKNLDPAAPQGATFSYERFEPVAAPTLLLTAPATTGAGLLRLVIRSRNSSEALDPVATTQTDSRHVVPPRISARLAEQHGLFDAPNGHLRADAALFNDITARDNFTYPQQGGVPIVTAPLATVGYLPDPLARGVALRDLPGTLDDTEGRIAGSAMVYSVLPDVQPRAGSVTYVDFGSAWPARSAFRLTLAEGNAAPAWNATARTLTIFLAKGASPTVDLSCYLNSSDLTIMGVWGWLSDYFAASELAAMQNSNAAVAVGSAADATALITRLVLEGGHQMLTPAVTVTLVHAVQQPLGRPAFAQLPVIHQPSNPIYASALRNSFTPITAWRAVSSHSTTLLGGLTISGATTAKIELDASWIEFIDEPSQGPPTRASRSAHVETIDLKSLDAGVLYADPKATPPRAVAVYIPKVDTLWFSSPIDVLDGVVTPSTDVAAPVHRFSDTLHRWVRYRAVATSRFQEYFPPGLDFTRASEELLVDVPSSARPALPALQYVIPTFGWQRTQSTNVKSDVRFGNGLRVYLSRPWFSSGADELLGVVLWSSATGPPDYPTRDKYKHLFTQWGNDPIWSADYLAPVPAISNFTASVASAMGLTLAETDAIKVDVAGHDVSYDSARGLWYCDITFGGSMSYMPFVRLALARYQPHTITGVELSRVALADYAQLTPDRSAVLTIDPSDPRQAQLFIGGVAPDANPPPDIAVAVERRLTNVMSDIGWESAPASEVTVTENSPDASEPKAALWSGRIAFSQVPSPNRYRVVIREYERIPIDPTDGTTGAIYGERLVYLSIMAYDFPRTP